MPKPKRRRTERREAERRLAKLDKDRERLFTLEAGGSPERPIDVNTPAIVEIRARALSCPLCEGELEVLEHAATTIDRESLREARMRCRRCGSRRSIWFRLARLN